MSKKPLSGRNTPTCSAHWKVHRRAGTSPYTVTFQDIKSQSNYLPLTSNNPTKRSQNNSIYKGIKNEQRGRSLAYTPTKTHYQKTCETPETHPPLSMDQTWPRPDACTGQSYLQISHSPVNISAKFLANVEKPLLKGHVEPGGTLSERKTSVEERPPFLTGPHCKAAGIQQMALSWIETNRRMKSSHSRSKGQQHYQKEHSNQETVLSSYTLQQEAGPLSHTPR